MSALLAPSHSLLQLLDQQREYSPDQHESCRFCQCTEGNPCIIPLREAADGNFFLARNEEETTVIVPCAWFAPKICSAPECMEKLLLEKRSRPILFEASGRRVHG